MADIIVRRLDDKVKERLRNRAARHGRSLEAEVREIFWSKLQQSTFSKMKSPKPSALERSCGSASPRLG